MTEPSSTSASPTDFSWRKQVLAHSLLDPSFWTLLAANLVALVVLLREDARLAEVLWIYWLQSVVIGAFHFRRVLDLRDFSTKGLKINGRPVAPTPATQRRVARFFALHYGLFHAMYGVFLVAQLDLGERTWIVLTGGLLFLVNHGYSYFANRRSDATRRTNIGLMLFSPYGRIVPMHLTIIFGGMIDTSGFTLILFVLLKTAIDLIAHTVGHVVRNNPDRIEAAVDNVESPARSEVD